MLEQINIDIWKGKVNARLKNFQVVAALDHCLFIKYILEVFYSKENRYWSISYFWNINNKFMLL